MKESEFLSFLLLYIIVILAAGCWTGLAGLPGWVRDRQKFLSSQPTQPDFNFLFSPTKARTETGWTRSVASSPSKPPSPELADQKKRKSTRVFPPRREGDLLGRRLRCPKSICGAGKPSLWIDFYRKNRPFSPFPSKDIPLSRRIFVRKSSKFPTFRPLTFPPLGRSAPNFAHDCLCPSPSHNSFSRRGAPTANPSFPPFSPTNKHEKHKKDIKPRRKVLTFASEMRNFLLKEKI